MSCNPIHRPWPRRTWLGLALLACMQGAPAQLAPRLSAQVVLDELAAAREGVAATAPPGSPLAQVRDALDALATAVRQGAGDDLTRPVELAGDAVRARIVRAHAAAARVRAYADAVEGCQPGDLVAMQQALALGVRQLSADAAGGKVVPVIDSVQTLDNQPVFAHRAAAGPWAIALVGEQLTDLQCADPEVVATDAAGQRLALQPRVTGTSPARVELRWADAAALPVGPVVLQLRTRHKVFLLGCTAVPPAQAVVQLAPPARATVDYALEALCPGPGRDGVVPLGSGALPLEGAGAAASAHIDTAACAAPQAYRLHVGVTGGDGHRADAGPFTQPAAAAITAGLPGGLTISWNPAVQTLAVRAAAARCRGMP